MGNNNRGTMKKDWLLVVTLLEALALADRRIPLAAPVPCCGIISKTKTLRFLGMTTRLGSWEAGVE